MLEGLDEINWAVINNAYGAAHDTPTHLRALLSEDDATRKDAMEHLWSSLCHQGTIYEASLYAVPFLLELVRAPAVQGKEAILYLLVGIAHGTFPNRWVLEEDRPLTEIDTPEARQEIDQRLGWVHQAYAAVRNGRDTYLLLLGDVDLEVRQAALAALVASCAEEEATVAPTLRQQFATEPDRVLHASIARCLGRFHPLAKETVVLLDTVRTGDEDPLARLAAVAALAHGLGERAEAGIAQDLAHALADPEAMAKGDYEKIIDDEGWPATNFIADLSYALRALGERGIEAALPSLSRAFTELCADTHVNALPPGQHLREFKHFVADDGSSNWREIEGRFIYPPTPALKLAEALLTVTFSSLEREPVSTPAVPSEQQRRTLTLLLECDTVWHYDINMDELLDERGLPRTREKLRQYVQHTTAG